MKILPVFLIVFWIIIVMMPEILAYLIWGLFIFIWLNLLLFFRKAKSMNENYVKFGKYKIFR
jgi:hypothetical protein